MSIQLSDEHELQVQAYLRFAKLKRDQHVREALSVITDFRTDKLSPGEMYNYKDLSALLEEMSDEMKALVDKEIQHAYHTNALLVKILLSQAGANGLELHVDTNQLENEFLLKQIAHSEDTALSRPASDFVRRNAQLGKLGAVGTIAVQDPKLLKERDEAQNSVAAMQEKMRALQEQTTQMMRERTSLNEQINQLKDQLASATQGQGDMLGRLQNDFATLSTQAQGAAAQSKSQYADMERKLQEYRGDLEVCRKDLAETRAELKDKERELHDARMALDGHLADSKQFQQMKKLMQQKSDQVVDLRKRLHKYEPQSVPSADGDY